MLTVCAPAKINLVLEVLGKYDDYHQISSVVQAISLCDVIRFQLAEGISFECTELSLEQGNLVTQAAVVLKETTKCDKGVRIKLRKNIPWGVGLGGGSSDAAATLLTLNKLWGLELAVSELASLAFKLGSDVSFFIYGGTALVEGKGEKVTPLPSLRPTWFVLLVPPLPKIKDKTGQLYRKLKASYFSNGEYVHGALLSLRQGRAITTNLTYNVFEELALDFFPELNKYRRSFEQVGASNVHITGSGPCLFTLLYEKEKANSLYLRLKKQGLESYVVSSLPKGSWMVNSVAARRRKEHDLKH